MPKRKDKTRNLINIGRDSTGVILPAAILDDLGWHKRQRVLVKKVPRGILIIDAQTKHRKKLK
jgi:hypothetical protein